MTQSTANYDSKAAIARMLEAMHGHIYQNTRIEATTFVIIIVINT